MFPSWAHPLLGFYAVAINKGGVDYDDIDARMAPESPFNSQPTYAKLTAGQKKQADSLNNLVRSLSEYRTTFEENTDKGGSGMFGMGAALLETKLNSIIFAAAQAEGTGALQHADREVIEKIIPNPTTFSGSISAAFKGGQGSCRHVGRSVRPRQDNPRTQIDAVGRLLIKGPMGAFLFHEMIRSGSTPT